MFPTEIWDVHPQATFLEPACGDGNFLVAILARKLDRLLMQVQTGTLPAGAGAEAIMFHALAAIASIYAVDISDDNIVGGTPGHERGARARLLSVFMSWFETGLVELSAELHSKLSSSAAWIVEHNLIVGNMLPTTEDGSPSGRDDIPLISYEFMPETLMVSLAQTTMGHVLSVQAEESRGVVSLFDMNEPVHVWTGPASSLGDAIKVVAPELRGPARNGRRRPE